MSRNSIMSRAATLGLLLAATLALALVVAVVARPEQTDAERSDRFWGSMWVQGTYQTYESLAAMTKAADLVLVGRIRGISSTRTEVLVPNWGDDGVVGWAVADVEIVRALKAPPDVATNSVAVELFAPTVAALDVLSSTVPYERTLFFLSATDGKLGLLNPESYLRDLGTVGPAIGAEQAWAGAWRGKPFEDLVAQAAQVAP